MKNSTSIIIILLISFQFSCCKTNSKKTETTPKIEEEIIIQQNKNGEREPAEDEIREFGIIRSIEEGQYPMFIVTVEFPDRQTKADFNLNIEAITQSSTELNSMKGKYATLYYTDNSENMLMDMHYKGKTLYEEDTEIAGYKSITGILSGAEKETAGDLPNTLYITDASGKKMPFDEFIISEVVAKNGKTVTGYYYTRYNQSITYIKESKD
jgi:hypothetical protein